jgi:polyhydroxyalkanoate synthase
MQKWLSDTPPIPGNLYRQIINDCYKNNLLISNIIHIVPLLTIVAEHDDLVSPESTLSVNHCVSSKKKVTRVSSGDHIELCVSSIARKE